jgi:hypothetical protein
MRRGWFCLLWLAPAGALAHNGSIAFSPSGAEYAAVYDVPTIREAQHLALDQCGRDDCEIVVNFYPGECAALAVGPDGWFTHVDATREAAALGALQQCAHPQCEVGAAVCNPTGGVPQPGERPPSVRKHAREYL